MPSLFSKIFRGRKSGSSDADPESFAARFHRFKLFLGAYADAYSEIMNFEERLADETPIGMPFLRFCTARLTIATMQCILQLNNLGSGRFQKLEEAFAALRADMQGVLAKGVTPLDGPMVVRYGAVEASHADIMSPSLVKLGTVRDAFPEFMPRGFVVTGSAWWKYFNDPEMHDEIDRIMLISREDPASYSEASATIRERMASSFPLPEELTGAIREMLREMEPELSSPGHTLLVRSMPVRLEHAALVMPEQVLHTPLQDDNVLAAVQSSLTMAYRTRGMIYRLKRGIRDRAMPLCVSVTLIPEVHGRGSVHRPLDGEHQEKLFLHIRRGFSVPESWPSQASVEGASLPEQIQKKVEQWAYGALDCLKDAPVRGNRHELFWVVSEEGDFYVLGVNALPDPVVSLKALENAAAACHIHGTFEGGRCTYPGLVRSKACLVRNFVDALNFPVGSILVLQRAAPRWAFLLDFAAGAICGDGTGNGLFARTARHYGRPSILGQPLVFERLDGGEQVSLIAVPGQEPLVCEDTLEPNNGDVSDGAGTGEGQTPWNRTAGQSGAAWPIEFPEKSPPLWLPESDIARMARELAPMVVALTLPDADDLDFRAENCKSFHDFLVYCHVHAVREMFRGGTSRKSSSAPAKQLVCDVPKQFWIINLDDGFYGEVKGPVVQLEAIASLPMRSLWEGFSAKPWDGPPPLNARGFLSVLFEASANPNLDPASQSTQYTEKNVFMIARRFCSMRCRFGFHFLSLDCLLSERERERFIVFQFKGGAADLSRRIKRVHFVSELLAQFDFATEITGDTLTARLEQGNEKTFLSALRVLGYLVMHTRQLDMIMGDEEALAAHRFRMLEDMLALAAREPLPMP